MHVNGILIAAPSSGSGKTTVSVGIMLALTSMGYNVQPFKVGPDYIDPQFHRKATGNPAYNLDTVMGSKKIVTEIYNRNSSGKDISIIEGVMGLFDGKSGKTSHGSSYEIAKILKIPVIMVVNVSSSGRSIAAVLKGFQLLAKDIRIAGVIINKAGSAGHCALVSEAIKSINRIPVLGCIQKNDLISIKSRYLGLIPESENSVNASYFNNLKDIIKSDVDLNKVISISKKAHSVPSIERLYNKQRPYKAKIAVAYNRAFNFYYRENLDLLEKYGAEIIYFDPEKDKSLPECDGIYIGGGYPEIYARELSENTSMLEEIRSKIENNMPVFAECAGYMYLSEAIMVNEEKYNMVNAVPAITYMEKLVIGYRSVTAMKESFLFKPGDKIRGHEFHRSKIKFNADHDDIYSTGNERFDGYARKNMVAGYTHLYFPSNQKIPERFVDACKTYRKNCMKL